MAKTIQTHNPISFLGDAGYLSYVYGSSAYGTNSWLVAKQNYSAMAGCLLCMDSHHNLRKDFFPEYKAHRAVKAENDPRKMQIVERVRAFRSDVLEEDPSIRSFKVDGLEADDIIALILSMKLMPLGCKVVGGDKDLLQIPIDRMNLQNANGEQVKIQKFANKQAVALAPLIKFPHQILLTLAIMGDKSDNVPRILPSRSYEQVVDIFHPNFKNPFSKAASRFGQAFLKNLWITILPFPELLDPIIRMEDLPIYLDETKDRWAYGIDFKVRVDLQEAIHQVLTPHRSGTSISRKYRTIENLPDAAILKELVEEIQPKRKMSIRQAHSQLAEDDIMIEILEERKKRLKILLTRVLSPIDEEIEVRKGRKQQLSELVRLYHKKQPIINKPKFIIRKTSRALNIKDYEGLRIWAFKQEKARAHLFTLDTSRIPQVIELMAKTHPDWLVLNTKAIMSSYPSADDIPGDLATIDDNIDIALRWELLRKEFEPDGSIMEELNLSSEKLENSLTNQLEKYVIIENIHQDEETDDDEGEW